MIRYAPSVVLVLLGNFALAQTQVDLRTQARNVDFSNAAATRPAKVGSTLPVSCTMGEMFFKTDSIAGQNLHLCVGLNTWNQIQGNGSGSGGGTSISSGLIDLQVLRLSSTGLTIGTGCSQATPCVLGWGNRSISITSPASVTISAGSGIAFIYVSMQGTLTVGHTMTLSCTGCTAQSGVAQFPANSIPIATWSSFGGIWDINGGLDMRGFLSTKPVSAGSGLLSSDVAGEAILSIDPSSVATRVGVPATATTACSTGAYAIDAQFYYSCVALNTWRRVALAVW